MRDFHHGLLGGVPEGARTDFSFWWADDRATVKEVFVCPEGDLALCRLEPFDKASVEAYPVFKNPGHPIESGTSLCRLGFPFHQIKPSYENGRFVLPEQAFPMVFFPNEGILTRVAVVRETATTFIGFIETSSAGLMGQSGGPILDQRGTVWGVQSHTSHLPLGFSPSGPDGKPEHQFLNVGRGVHPGTIVGLLKERNVRHSVSAY